jgi:methylthioribose-1-phosphate isomerase
MKTSDSFQTVWWEDGNVCLVDQRLLPNQEVVVRCAALGDVVQGIRSMQVRGAPAIGCTAAYGMALVAHRSSAATTEQAIAELEAAKESLDAARPTAVNLTWATG